MDEIGDICPMCNREIGGPRHKCGTEVDGKTAAAELAEALREMIACFDGRGGSEYDRADAIKCARAALAKYESK